MPITYRNKNTGDVYSLAEESPRLEALSNWERLDDVELHERTQLALDRSAAERKTIEAAAGHRLDITKAAAEGTVNKATADETSLPRGAQPVPTVYSAQPEAHAATGGVLDKLGNAEEIARARQEREERAARDIDNPPTTGVLARAKADQKSGATQIGENPEEHQSPRKAAAAKRRKADKDADVDPPTVGSKGVDAPE